MHEDSVRPVDVRRRGCYTQCVPDNRTHTSAIEETLYLTSYWCQLFDVFYTREQEILSSPLQMRYTIKILSIIEILQEQIKRTEAKERNMNVAI
jgi:hypothetical protein